MTTKPRAFIPFLLLLSILLLSATLALSTTEGDDPERRMEQCKQECREQEKGKREQKECEQRCEEEYREHHGEDPQKRLEKCRRECREQEKGRREQKECEQRCEREYRERRGGNKVEQEREEGKEEEEKRRGSDPFFFGEESFVDRVATDRGHISLLRNFIEKSRLLLGIANYRVAILEVDPRTFVIPSHFDAEIIMFVARGNGLITLTPFQDRTETYELSEGDLYRVRAGRIVSVTNTDGVNKLEIVCLAKPVGTPGMVESFVGASGENPESFYRMFSDRILRAAFNTQQDLLDKLFGTQKKGPMIEISEEQAREMRRQARTEGRPWPFGESGRPVNLFGTRPSFSNRHGELREVDCNDHPELEDLDIRVSYANISRGSMISPYYNTMATRIAVVIRGRGQAQIVYPHVSREREEGRGREEEEQRGRQEGREEEEQQQQRGRRYQSVESRLSSGTVFVVLPGHPSVIISSREANLEVLFFEITCRKDRRIWLSGRNIVWKQMDRVTKELAFDLPARVVDEVLNAQKEEVFLEGPEERERGSQRREGRDGPLESILGFAGF